MIAPPATVKKTGGGLYQRDAPYLLFVANILWRSRHTPPYYPYSLIPYSDIPPTIEGYRKFEHILTPGHVVFVDSGVFSLVMALAAKKGTTDYNTVRLVVAQEAANFQQYVDHYCQFVQQFEPLLWGYVEVDVGDSTQKTRIRASMEAKGLVPIPVYHPFSDEWEYFDELASQYDRVCVGNLSHTPGPLRLRLLATIHERTKQYPHLWVHLLGLRNHQWFSGYPVHSSDASSWMTGVMHGHYNCFVDGVALGNLSQQYTPTSDVGSDSDHLKGTLFCAYQQAMDTRTRQVRELAMKGLGYDLC